MFYLLNFKDHSFCSCENAAQVEAKIRSLMSSGCSKDSIEIINGMLDEVRLDVDQFRTLCLEYNFLNPVTQQREVFLASPLADLDLSVRAYNTLRRAGISTIGELVNKTEAELKSIRTLGWRCFDEIVSALASHGEALASVPLLERTDEPTKDAITTAQPFWQPNLDSRLQAAAKRAGTGSVAKEHSTPSR